MNEAPNASGEAPAPAQATQAMPAAPPSSAPQTNPAAFRLGGEPPRVTRLSRKMLAALGMVAGIGIGGALLYALQTRQPAAPQNLYDTSRAPKSEVVTRAPGSYDKVPKLGPPMPGDLGRVILAAQQNGQQVPVPGMGTPSAGPVDPGLAAAEQAQQRTMQERDSARTSTLFLGGSHGTGAVAVDTATTAPVAGNAAAAGTNAIASGGQAGNRAFMQVASNRTTVSAERITAPTSPNVVQAGSVIPAALITGIRSDLPGQITAQVTQNVYDSPTGRILLIPQGARLIGEYDSEVAAGQTRVLLAWDRLVLPGGRSLLLDRQPGGDASGYAGLQDKVNYHWGNMLRAAAISTLLGVGTEMATDSNDALVQALRYGTQDTINQVGKQLIQREMNVAPTLTIRPGTPLRVILTRDLVLEPQGGTP